VLYFESAEFENFLPMPQFLLSVAPGVPSRVVSDETTTDAILQPPELLFPSGQSHDVINDVVPKTEGNGEKVASNRD
jgi:hypothetical protein